MFPEGKGLCVLHKQQDVLREAQVPAETEALAVLSALEPGAMVMPQQLPWV